MLAGDILKTALNEVALCEDRHPVERGYSDQYLDKNGYPQHSRQNYDRAHLEDTGVTVNLWIRVRRLPARFGRPRPLAMPLYLLTQMPGTSHGWITRQLYASFRRNVAAEMVLGIGGMRFKQLGFQPDI